MRSLNQGTLEVWRRAFALGTVGGYVLSLLVGCVEDQLFALAHEGRAPMISSTAAYMIAGLVGSPIGAALGSIGTWVYARRKERQTEP